MTKRIHFESDSQPNRAFPDRCATLFIELSIECRTPDGTDASYVIEYITNLNDRNAHVTFAQLPETEQRKIAALAEQLCLDCAEDAAQEYAEGMSDWLYDSCTDQEMEREP